MQAVPRPTAVASRSLPLAGTAGGAPLGLGWAGHVLPPGAGRAEASPLDAVPKLKSDRVVDFH